MPWSVSSRLCSSVKSEPPLLFTVPRSPDTKDIVHPHSVTGSTIEDSLTVAPRHEWVLFCNRDKFDLIAIYDDGSKTPGPPNAPLARLIHAIYETAFRKILKRVPVLLIGGLEAWRHEFGVEELVVAETLVDPIPLATPPSTEVYVSPSPQPPASLLPQVSRPSPPGVVTSPKSETFRTPPLAPRSPLPNQTRAGTESVPDARPSPGYDNYSRRSFDQGPVASRYGLITFFFFVCVG